MTLWGMFGGGKKPDRYEIIGPLVAMIPINCKTFITERDVAFL
jgi:drug/metabolite transporter superfamily protein YnfA